MCLSSLFVYATLTPFFWGATGHMPPNPPPLVISPGGLVAKLSWEELGKWKEGLGTLRWQRLLSQISLELLRAKGRLFEM